MQCPERDMVCEVREMSRRGSYVGLFVLISFPPSDRVNLE